MWIRRSFRASRLHVAVYHAVERISPGNLVYIKKQHGVWVCGLPYELWAYIDRWNVSCNPNQGMDKVVLGQPDRYHFGYEVVHVSESAATRNFQQHLWMTGLDKGLMESFQEGRAIMNERGWTLTINRQVPEVWTKWVNILLIITS